MRTLQLELVEAVVALEASVRAELVGWVHRKPLDLLQGLMKPPLFESAALEAFQRCLSA